MSGKKLKAVLIGSPLILVQFAFFVYMTFFSLRACRQAFSNQYVLWSYCIAIVYNMLMMVISLLKTFMVEPGKVTPALLDKLKNQLLTPKQHEKLESMLGDMNRRQYLLKCLNSAIAKHIARRPNSAINQFANCIQADMELLELQPTTTFEAQRGSNMGRILSGMPEVCKFTYCEPCQQVMPPRSEHCDLCKQCTLRVDHHCFWMGNSCIGLLNHKFFILFLLNAVCFCASVMGPFAKLLVDGNQSDEEWKGVLSLLADYPNEFVTMTLAIALFLGLTFMLIYQIVILLFNKTTMEVAMDPRRNPFRHRGVIRNIEMVFGSRKCTWLSPFHDPFPNMKLHGFTASQRQMMQYGVPVANKTAGGRGLDYVQCIIPTIRSV